MANVEIPDVPRDAGSPFQTFMAVCIAIITVIGALIAWRTTVLSELSADADFQGIVTVVRAQEAQTTSSARVYQRYRAYTEYIISKTIGDSLEEALQEFEDDPVFQNRLNEARNAQANNLQYFNTAYIIEDSYDLERDFNTSIADASLRTPLDPTSFYNEADNSRKQASFLIQIFMVLGVALFAFSFAEALHKERRFLKYTVALIGLVAMISSIVLTVMNEVN